MESLQSWGPVGPAPWVSPAFLSDVLVPASTKAILFLEVGWNLWPRLPFMHSGGQDQKEGYTLGSFSEVLATDTLQPRLRMFSRQENDLGSLLNLARYCILVSQCLPHRTIQV